MRQKPDQESDTPQKRKLKEKITNGKYSLFFVALLKSNSVFTTGWNGLPSVVAQVIVKKDFILQKMNHKLLKFRRKNNKG